MFTCYAPVHPSGFYNKIQEMRIYQKDINSEKDFYREITRQIQESKAEFMYYPNLEDVLKDDVGCMSRLFKLLEQNRNYEEVILSACLNYISSENCPKDEVAPLREALKKYMYFLLRIEKFFEYIDWKSYFYERLEEKLSEITI